MGIIKKGILGGFSGIVGNVGGASWKGIDYIGSIIIVMILKRETGMTASCIDML